MSASLSPDQQDNVQESGKLSDPDPATPATAREKAANCEPKVKGAALSQVEMLFGKKLDRYRD